MKGHTQQPLLHQSSAPQEENLEQSGLKTTRKNNVRDRCVRSHRVRNNTKRTFGFLSLPDEVVSQIFAYLNAGDTSFSTLKPRHAFSLALTNTRLLRVFKTHITRIVPHLHDWDRLPISSAHLLAVMRTAGEFVRELHVPRTCLSIVTQIPILCPQLEKLVVQEDWDYSSQGDERIEIRDLFLLPLQSLSIDYPYETTVAEIPETPQPQEISLLNCHCDYLLQLSAIAFNPPKKLHIHILFTSWDAIDDILDYLRDLCKKVEEFTLKSVDIPDQMPVEGCLRIRKFLKLLRKDRSHTQSKCKRMVLNGEMVTDFVECAHPEAYVEVTSFGQTFVQNGDEIYPTKIPLWDEYLTQDLSRVTHVFIGASVNPIWHDIVSKLCLSKATVVSPKCVWDVLGKVDVVELKIKHASQMNWRFIHGAKEVRLMGYWIDHFTKEALQALAKLLTEFRGKAVFLEHYGSKPLPESDDILQSLLVLIRDAVDKFEGRGGDARSIREMLRHMRQE